MDIKCICHNTSLREAAQKAASVGELQELKICATKCKLCVPYLEDKFKKINLDKAE